MSENIENLVKGKLSVYQDLEISGTPKCVFNLFEEIKNSVLKSEYWTKEDIEKNLWGDMKQYCFKVKDFPNLENSKLWITIDDGRLSISNIVPDKLSHLSHSQYNSILMEFFSKFIEPHLKNFDVKSELMDEALPITHWMSEEAATALARFVLLANQSTGRSHPMDHQRWLEFLFQYHTDSKKTKKNLSASTLQRWFSEIASWKFEDKSWDLALEFDHDTHLLETYDKFVSSGRIAPFEN